MGVPCLKIIEWFVVDVLYLLMLSDTSGAVMITKSSNLCNVCAVMRAVKFHFTPVICFSELMLLVVPKSL